MSNTIDTNFTQGGQERATISSKAQTPSLPRGPSVYYDKEAQDLIFTDKLNIPSREFLEAFEYKLENDGRDKDALFHVMGGVSGFVNDESYLSQTQARCLMPVLDNVVEILSRERQGAKIEFLYFARREAMEIAKFINTCR